MTTTPVAVVCVGMAGKEEDLSSTAIVYPMKINSRSI